MALSHATQVFGVNDASIWKLSTDPSGGLPTYGTKYDVPGAESMTAQMGMDIKELRGDNSLLSANAIFKEIKGDIKYGKFSFDALGSATTASATDSGTTPNQKVTQTLVQSDMPAYFKAEGQSKQVDYVGGDMHFVLFKCMPSTLDAFGFTEEDYNKQTIGYTAVPLIGTISGGPANAWVQAVANETAVAIA